MEVSKSQSVGIVGTTGSGKTKKTMVILAHWLTTIENCDVVYRVDGGKIIKER